jgi:hypothetical protein
MFPLVVVEDFNVLKDGGLGCHVRRIPFVMYDFLLYGAKKAFHSGVVVAVALAGHRTMEAMFSQRSLVITASVLKAPSPCARVAFHGTASPQDHCLAHPLAPLLECN